MKKDMKEVENKIKITEESLMLVNEIISKMEGKTFHNHYHILYDIASSFNKNDLTYLEIGAFGGGSASLISKHKNISKIYSIDIGYPIKKEIPIKNVNKFKHNECKYTYIEGNSRLDEVIKQVYQLIESVDILFIDGDHSYDGVIDDFKNYIDLVKKGGFIIFDDYMDKQYSPEVYNAVNYIVSTLDLNKYEIIGSINYELIKKTNQPTFKSSNEFIIKKI